MSEGTCISANQFRLFPLGKIHNICFQFFMLGGRLTGCDSKRKNASSREQGMSWFKIIKHTFSPPRISGAFKLEKLHYLLLYAFSLNTILEIPIKRGIFENIRELVIRLLLGMNF